MGKARKHGHYCKACSRLTAAEKAEGTMLNRLMSLRWRLSDGDKSWLKDRMMDERPAVRNLACQQFAARYPHMNLPALEHDDADIKE